MKENLELIILLSFIVITFIVLLLNYDSKIKIKIFITYLLLIQGFCFATHFEPWPFYDWQVFPYAGQNMGLQRSYMKLYLIDDRDREIIPDLRAFPFKYSSLLEKSILDSVSTNKEQEYVNNLIEMSNNYLDLCQHNKVNILTNALRPMRDFYWDINYCNNFRSIKGLKIYKIVYEFSEDGKNTWLKSKSLVYESKT